MVTILGNLAQNAIEALRAIDRKDKRILIDVHKQGDTLVLQVSDNGEGIAPEVRDSLFEWGTTSKTGGKNMGIGLSLVKMHTTMYNGTIEVHEEAGVTVTVSLDAALVIEGEI
jgi:two-component system cit operon sensor histidine kinase CitA